VATLRQQAEERARAAELERVRAEGERLAAELRAAEEGKRRRAQRALAVSVILLLLGGLSFGWWQAEQGRIARERQARNAEAVAGLLKQCEESLQSGDAAAAAVRLEAAQQRAREGGAESHAEKLVQCQDDLAVLRGLDAADQLRWMPVEGKLREIHGVASRYREALGRFGADPDAVGVEAAVARVSGSAVRERLVAALDRLLREEKSAAVRAALQRLDADRFRDAVRDAERGNDPAALVKLAAQAEALAQPPGFAAFLGESSAVVPERQRELLGAALRRHPGDLGLLMGLGRSYPWNQPESSPEAVRWFQAAVAVAPANPVTHVHLGGALLDQKDLAGAFAEDKEAIRLDPNYAMAHNNLGWALEHTGDLEGAIAQYREAIRVGPKLVVAHLNLGQALQSKGDLDGALAAEKEAIRLDPENTILHNDLGSTLYLKGDLDGAIAAWDQAIRLDPKHVLPRRNMGLALQAKGDLDGAIAAYKEALRLDPRYAAARANLQPAQRMRELLPRLAGVLASKDKPQSLAEACEFAELCAQPFQKRYGDAVRIYAEAFTADPKLAEDLRAGHRYNAACCAALAGCGKGKDADKHDDKERARLRGQALEWLRADLLLRRRQASSSAADQRQKAAARLSHWLVDSDLAGVRPGPSEVALPAAERAEWAKLWADVRATLAQARKPAPLAATDTGKK
jgi:tetratricopeptide (TPR) repeat protein